MKTENTVTLEYPATGEFTIRDVETLNQKLNLKSYVISFQVKKDYEAGKLVRLTKTRPTGGKGKPANLYTVAPETVVQKIEIVTQTEPVVDVAVTPAVTPEVTPEVVA